MIHIGRFGCNDIDEVPFQAMPRVGESVSMAIDGDTLTLRGSRAVHVPERTTPDGGSTVVGKAHSICAIDIGAAALTCSRDRPWEALYSRLRPHRP
ncbi:hypothetical protein CIT31_25870 [Mesorhizobium wenxiniae]|uniref:Uncharacterized protein n=1 Tax=Mesorhizobium wenxiniae TaxID=2014805 RepID=A0A271KAQ5_9HYPH|nr:hypothetical protein CIT31_25870 [Mesorhizobium wenxiniae]